MMILLRRLSRTTSTSDHADWRIYFYAIAQLVGGAALTVLLITMLWPTKKRRPRNPLLVSLCLSWWMSTFPCLGILYYARQVTGPPPTYPVCLASAALTTGQSMLVGTTAPALMFHIWLTVKTAIGSPLSDRVWTARSRFLCLILPYILFVTVAITTMGIGLDKPHLVHRALFYCVVDDDRLTIALGVLETVTTTTAIIFEICTVILLYHNRSCIRQLSRDGLISLVVRVCVFGLYVFLGLCLNVISTIEWANPVPDLFFSTFGIACFVVFGTQRDIWRIWLDATRQISSSPSYHNSSNPSPPRPSLGFRSTTHPPVFNQLLQSQPESQRHLSLSQFNLDSRSFYQSQPSTQSQIYNPNAISIPLPATLRSSVRPPAIVLHSTPDLDDSLPSTPTSYGPPVPANDSKFSPVCPHGLMHDSSDFNLAFNVPPLSHPSIQRFAPIVFEPEEPGVPAHFYPPTIEERSPRSRWRILGGVGRLSSRGRDDIGIASGDSRMMSRPVPVPEVRQTPDRSESPVWEPGANGAEGEMVWRAL